MEEFFLFSCHKCYRFLEGFSSPIVPLLQFSFLSSTRWDIAKFPVLQLLGQATENLPWFLLAFRGPYRALTAKQPATRLGSVALQSLLSVVAAWRGSYPVVWKCQWQGTAVCCGLLNASSLVSSRDTQTRGKKALCADRQRSLGAGSFSAPSVMLVHDPLCPVIPVRVFSLPFHVQQGRERRERRW